MQMTSLAENRAYRKRRSGVVPMVGDDRELLRTLALLRQGRRGHRAVHILFSALRDRTGFAEDLAAANEIAAQVLSAAAQHKIFNLSNGDIVFVYLQLPTPAVMGLCSAVEKTFFEGQPLKKNIYGDYGYYKLFDMAHEGSRLTEGVRQVLSVEKLAAAVAKPPIGAAEVTLLAERLRAADIRSIIFNQPVYNIRHPKPSIEFLEFYTSITRLEQAFVPDFSIPANPWLFNLIKRDLDSATLRCMNTELTHYRHKAFSFNLLVESVLSDGFRAFLSTLPVKLGGKVYAELDKADLIQHSACLNDLFLCSRQLDVPLCIDGLSHHDMHFLQFSRLQGAYIKLKWDADIGQTSAADMIALVEELRRAQARIVLTRCDNPKALAFARAVGISFVQGHLADEMFRNGEQLGTPQGHPPLPS